MNIRQHDTVSVEAPFATAEIQGETVHMTGRYGNVTQVDDQRCSIEFVIRGAKHNLSFPLWQVRPYKKTRADRQREERMKPKCHCGNTAPVGEVQCSRCKAQEEQQRIANEAMARMEERAETARRERKTKFELLHMRLSDGYTEDVVRAILEMLEERNA